MNNDNFADYDLIDLKNKQHPESALVAEAWALFLKYKFAFAVCLLVSLALGYAHIRTTPKKFMRTATVMVKDSKNGGMMESQRFNEMMELGSSSVENEMGIFKSRRLMYRVAERLHLDVSYRALNLKKAELYSSSPIRVHFMDVDESRGCSMTVKIITPETVELSEMTIGQEYNEIVKIEVGKTAETPLGRLRVEIDTAALHRNGEREIIMVSRRPLKQVANAYCSQLRVEAIGGKSSLLNLSLIDENARRAEDVLNTLIEVYNEDAIEDKNRVTNNTGNFIEERLAVIEKELNMVDSDIERFKKENRLTDILSESSVFLNKSNSLDNERLNLENQLNMTDYMKDYLNRNNKSSDMIPASIGIEDNGIQAQIADYNEIVVNRNKLIANSSEHNPVIKDMDMTLKSQKKAILRAIDNLQTSLALQVMNMEDKELETYDKITNLPSQQKEIIRIERQQKVKEELYLYLLNKKEENELQQTIAESNCKVVDVADGPSAPVSPNKIQVILICLIAGVAFPAGFIYARSLIDTKVYVKEDVKDKVSIPFLGDLPFDRVKETSDMMLISGSKHEHLNEALRIVRENLNFILPHSGEEGKVVQMISLRPNSGKTFISINLGACISLSGKRVVILDLDLRKASLTRRLGMSSKQEGASHYLSGNVTDVNSLIHTIDTQAYSFDVIPSGILPPNPAELLKSDKLEELVEKLKQRYDYVLFDNPPFGMVVDAFICSRLVDQSIYIIRSGMFDKRLLPDLRDLYESGKIKHMALLLNGVDYKKMVYSYKYGYGYGYGYHYGNTQQPETRFKRWIKWFFS